MNPRQTYSSITQQEISWVEDCFIELGMQTKSALRRLCGYIVDMNSFYCRAGRVDQPRFCK